MTSSLAAAPIGVKTAPTNMDFFNYKNNELHCENVPAARIATEVGAPIYVYSEAHHHRQVADAQSNPAATTAAGVAKLAYDHLRPMV